MNSHAAPSSNRHPELVSGSISPRGPECVVVSDLTARPFSSHSLVRAEEWTLKRVQGDEIRYWVVL